jgi:uncharacterized membrane protein HdeD (DUF308 family)
MNTLQNYWGATRAWWVLLVVGIIFVVAGFAYWLYPFAGYYVATTLFGWMLVAVGVVQLCVSASATRSKGRGWWLAGGVVDMFAGFVLVRNLFVAETIFPYFLALVFIYWGVAQLAGLAWQPRHTHRWLRAVNAILLLLIGFMFVEEGYMANVANIALLTSIGFIYWGFTMAVGAAELRPIPQSR